MIRFKVVKGSHLLLVISLLILLAVITFVMLQGGFFANPDVTAKIVPQQSAATEAKAISAFASTSDASSGLKIEILPDQTPDATQSPLAKQILIYHTHTHEAYEPDAQESYAALEAWRTDDTSHNVVQLGKVLAEELRARGYAVIHDTTDHEQDSLGESYVRSLETLESYAQHFDLCIDLHRDAYVEGMQIAVSQEDQEYALMMCLVGRGDRYPETEKPNYEKNLQFAQNITVALNNAIPGVCRNVTVKTGRYNQHIGEISLLIEVGHNKNTLHQALNSIPILANGIDICLSRP